MIDRRSFFAGLGAIAAYIGARPAFAFARPSDFERAVRIIRSAAKAAIVDEYGGESHCLASLRFVCLHFGGDDTGDGLRYVSLNCFDIMLQVDARLKALRIGQDDRRAAFSNVASDLCHRENMRSMAWREMRSKGLEIDYSNGWSIPKLACWPQR